MTSTNQPTVVTPEFNAGGVEKAAAAATKELAAAERQSVLTKAYNNASNRLRDAHRDEFVGYQTEEAKKLGVEWSPRATKEDKAKAEIARLLAEFPHLKEELA